MNSWTARKKWAVFAGVPAVVTALTGITFALMAQRSLDAAKAEARAAGIPLTSAELDRLASPEGPEQNSALAWARARSRLDAYKELTSYYRVLGQPSLPPRVPDFLRELDAALSDFRQAAELPNYFENRSEPPMLPRHVGAYYTVNELCIGAVLFAKRGEYPKARECMRCAFALSSAVGRGPSPGALLMSKAMASVCLEAASQLAAQNPEKPEAMRLAKELVSGFQPTVNLRRSLLGDGPFVMESDADQVFPPLVEKVANRLHRVPSCRAVMQTAGLAQLLNLDSGLVEARGDWRRELEECRAAELRYAATPMNILDTSFQAAAEVKPNLMAMQKCCGVMLCALEYRSQHGLWPKTLDELKTDIADPLGSGRLNWSVVHGTAKVWSVGPDGKNGGGFFQQDVGAHVGSGRLTLTLPWK